MLGHSSPLGIPNPSFAITLSERVIGSFDVRVDTKNNVAEVGYAVSKAHWGKGIIAEAGSAAFGLGVQGI